MERGPWLVVGGLVVAAVVGWALWSVTGPAEAPEDARGAEGERAAGPVSAPEGARNPVRGGIKPAPASAEGDARRRGAPPPRVEPSVTLEQARRDYADVIAEIDSVAAAGRRLDQAAYVELYKRGNDALLPLQQHLSWGDPKQAEELRTAQLDFRTKLRAIEPRPTPD